MKPMHYLSAAGILVTLGLYVAGQPEAAGVVLVLALVVEVIVSAVTGKKGNDSER
ncbi:hypothetical protein [Acidovorax sp.]|uniref:hypothetical protein n=1 Tax=Acidovorax sp. TaxID=1872122 RepID=UPI00391F297F